MSLIEIDLAENPWKKIFHTQLTLPVTDSTPSSINYAND